jgi:hypothetical protein
LKPQQPKAVRVVAVRSVRQVDLNRLPAVKGGSRTATARVLRLPKPGEAGETVLSIEQVSTRVLPRPVSANGAQGPTIVCVLCGEEVNAGQLLAHKRMAHNEKPTKAKRKKRSGKFKITSIVSGGLPSLGKNSR